MYLYTTSKKQNMGNPFLIHVPRLNKYPLDKNLVEPVIVQKEKKELKINTYHSNYAQFILNYFSPLY
jgi:hypothetical protein